MKLEIHAPDAVAAGKAFTVRAVLFNDSYAPVAVSRNALLGPTVKSGAGMTPPAVEATFGQADEPLTLQPFTFYGRERQADGQQAGTVDITVQYTSADGPITASKTVRIG
ncbi:MAG: hypothetical protein JNL34_09735 [Anaerolineae bacterium]|nr:hypothetical protein [Anaerolineae bacterium]